MAVATIAAIPAAHAERLTIAVSTPEVQITSNFSGVAVAVFGVIEGGDEQVFLNGHYDAAVVVIGPPQSVVERRKDRILGIWANSAVATLVDSPAFYALDTTRPIDAIASAAARTRLNLGFDNLALTFADQDQPAAAGREFRDAFIRLQSQAGLFAQGSGIRFIGDTIFRSNIFLPANIPEGKYTVLAYLFTGQNLVAAAESSLTVSKIGFEQTVASFAGGQPLIYGLLTIALSIFVGWLGGVIFRRD
jgi:uncharacterized protein (TIGR02186 family)